MNEVVNAILERRSIRSYQEKAIEKETLERIVTAGMYAPSSRGIQPWHVTVVTNAGKIAEITAQVKAAILRANVERYFAQAKNDNYSVNFHKAAAFVIVSANESETLCAAEDCSLVLGTMFLAAHSFGIGSCWINQLGCVTDEPEFRAFLTSLGVPPTHSVQCAAAFGYPEGPVPAPRPRRENTVNYVK